MSAPAAIASGLAAFMLALAVVGAASAVEARERLAGAADAAALAAADAVLGWIDSEPCDAVDRIAATVDADVQTCEFDIVTGEARVILTSGTVLGVVEVRSRAGPLDAE